MSGSVIEERELMGPRFDQGIWTFVNQIFKHTEKLLGLLRGELQGYDPVSPS